MKKILSITKNTITYILFIPIMIISLPIIIFSLPFFKRYNTEKRFGFLLKKSYTLEINNKIFKYKKDNTIISIIQDKEYKISFDNGTTYINLYESNIGTEEERNILKEVMEKYNYTIPIDKRRGNAIDTAKYYIAFLKKYIGEF